ncbi:T9SS type B sorting domain-containing protein [Hymenobacter oligotrophus]|uniref:T9SS type B sorting domain-containing protein n=1 Tax=Hymenobacter oligotrophus TaxID=2319843 RepID=UPI0013C2A868|nr:gliding motility-associated C-terminal domain-containing protein [Hymenobacter oligotrophus]
MNAPVWAQREYHNWYFGDSTGLSFVNASPAPSVLTNGKWKFVQGAASISDAAGNFLFASDAYTVWDRNWRPMPGRNISQVLRFSGFNRRQVMALPQPGSSSRYYVFASQREFYSNEYPVGGGNTRLFLPYVVVDMSARGGLGGIVARDSLELPLWVLHAQAPIYGLSSNWAAVRHTNGRDLWLVGVSDEGQYMSWLLSAAGLAAVPIVSYQPRWIGSGGILKASPDGRRLAFLSHVRAQRPTSVRYTEGHLELADFNTATGEVNNAQVLPTRFMGRNWYSNNSGGGGILSALKGLEFSPDCSRLYVDSAGTYPLQYNLLAGSAQAVDASRTQVQVPRGPGYGSYVTDMKLAPDGKIYLVYGNSFVGCISKPNALGNAAQLQFGTPNLQPRSAGSGTLPLSPNDLNLPPVVVTGAGSVTAGRSCAGEPIQFSSSLSPFVTASAYAWDFGEPSSGPLNTAAGQAPAHSYAAGGQYTVTLRVTATDGRQFTASQVVQVDARPQVSFTADTVLCHGQESVLSPGSQPAGSTYRWHDGSTAPTFTAAETGDYKVTVTSPAGCSTSGQVHLRVQDCPDLPNIITPNGDQQNDAFYAKGLLAYEWRCRIFNRWGKLVFESHSYKNNWGANQPNGVYYYELIHNRTGQRLKGNLEVLQ